MFHQLNLPPFVITVSLLGALLLLIACRVPRNSSPELEAPRSGDFTRALKLNDHTRSYLLHVPPSYSPDQPVPLVITLHGGGGHAQVMIDMTGMNEKADEAGFIAAYPNGSSRLENRLLTWNAGNCCGYAMEQGIDYVAFIRNLITSLQQEFAIDPKRIYVDGFSNGGMMTYRLGCELSDLVAAIAVVSGYLAYPDCKPTEPLPVIVFHGTADQSVPYDGGEPQKFPYSHRGEIPPVSLAVSFWVNHNHCSPDGRKQEKGKIIREEFPGCDDETKVIFYTIVDGGHAWPGGKQGPSPIADKPTQELSATDMIWDFFARHTKN